MGKISFIIPSINRPTLHRTLESIEVWPGDEVLVEFDLPPSGKWGNEQRNKAMARATGDYLAFIDDDDYYVPGHRQIMENAMNENPGKPNLFRMQYPGGRILWETKQKIAGNIGSPMIFVPNDKKMLFHWFSGRIMADFIFTLYWKWTNEEIIWRDEIIALLGHDNEKLNDSTHI